MNGGVNTYAYVNGNPLVGIDPNGQSTAVTAALTTLLFVAIVAPVAEKQLEKWWQEHPFPDFELPNNSASVPATKYKYFRCSVAETNECKATCESQGKTMESCLKVKKTGPGIKEGQVVPEIGNVAGGGVSCSCNEKKECSN